MEEREEDISESHPETRVALILQEGIKRKGITLSKLSEQTDIALKHLENISSGNSEKWPAAPYLRSYLIAIGDTLGFDGLTLWESIREEDITVASGSTDRLPRNRFSFLNLNKGYLGIGAIVLFILIFFLARLPSILGTPTIQINFPQEELTTIGSSPILIEGTLENGTQVTINGQTIPLEEGGVWSTEVALESGLNTIEIIGSKFLGRETKVIRQIIFEPVARPTSTLLETSTASSTSTTTEEESF